MECRHALSNATIVVRKFMSGVRSSIAGCIFRVHDNGSGSHRQFFLGTRLGTHSHAIFDFVLRSRN